jgi:hypothetical protein
MSVRCTVIHCPACRPSALAVAIHVKSTGASNDALQQQPTKLFI